MFLDADYDHGCRLRVKMKITILVAGYDVRLRYLIVYIPDSDSRSVLSGHSQFPSVSLYVVQSCHN